MAPRLAGQLVRNKGQLCYVTLQFCFLSSKDHQPHAFWDDRISFKYQLASLCISGGKTTPHHMAGRHAAGNGTHFNWLDYCKTMAPLLCLAEGLLPLVVCVCSKWRPSNAWRRVSRFIFRKGLEATPLIPTLPPAHGREHKTCVCTTWTGVCLGEKLRTKGTLPKK